MNNVKVAISAHLSEERDTFELIMQTEDGSPLTPQKIIDVIGDYLLIDPHGLFTNDGG